MLLQEIKKKGPAEPAPSASQPTTAAKEREPVLGHALRAESAQIAAAAPQTHPRYGATALPPVLFDKDRFTEQEMRPVISRQIESVMRMEAPVSIRVLTMRIREAWGFGRAGAKIEQAIVAAVPRDVVKRGDFLWRSDQRPDDFDKFRADSAESETRRDLDEIAPEEQAAAMAWLVERFTRVPESDLLRETASIFGRKAVTETAKAALASGLRCLLSKGFGRSETGDIYRR